MSRRSGTLAAMKKPMAGQRFGRLVVIRERKRPASGDRAARWLCLCDCGKTYTVRGVSLRSGHTKSCGCIKRTHGESHGAKARSPEYRSWESMKRRCLNQRDTKYPRYGARGILICAQWLDNYAAFLEDMGRKPSPRHTLDRIENDGNYEPGNCRWATPGEQSRNSSRSWRVRLNGRVLTKRGLAAALGISRTTIDNRLRSGDTVADIIATFTARADRSGALCLQEKKGACSY